MTYGKATTYYKDYIWTTKYNSDDPKITGNPDNVVLSRTEGWEMVYFINKLADLWKWEEDNLTSRWKLEVTIRNKVPSSIRSRKGIREWIEANWESFWHQILL
jgi:hypothetical protein